MPIHLEVTLLHRCLNRSGNEPPAPNQVGGGFPAILVKQRLRALHTAFRVCLFASVITTALLSPGCSETSQTTRDESARPVRKGPLGPINPIEERVDHVMGTTLVLPVSVLPSLAKPGPISAQLEDGREIDAKLVWIRVEFDPNEFARWLPEAGSWSAIDTLQGRPGEGQGYWAILTDLPLDSAGQGIWIERGLIEINWVAPPPEGRASGALGPVFPEAVGSPGYQAYLTPELSSPSRRWRARLSAEGLAAAVPSLTQAREQNLPPMPDALEAIAAQQEARWAAALARLHQDDPDLCDRLRRVLCMHAELDNGTRIPVWPLSQRQLDRLLSELLNPGGSARSRARAVADFLADQPLGLAWVIDDAGIIDAATGDAISTVGVVNLGDRATLAWAASSASESPANITTLQSGHGVALTSSSRKEPDGTGSIQINVGRWSTSRAVLSAPIPVSPPGLRMGPFLPAWTLDRWQTAAETPRRPGDAEWTTAALLERLPGSNEEWTLYVECLRPEQAGNDADSVRIWLGPRSKPISVIRVTRGGTATDELALNSTQMLAGSMRLQSDRWSFRIRLPRTAFDADGSITIGLERIGSQGRRWTWPRPIAPWQSEPGRARLDTSRWG